MTDIITTLHPENDEETNLYPNIKKENIPNNVIDINKLSDDVKSLLNSINELHPSGTDTSTNILAFTTNKGIYVATDNGHWYYWNGTQYADGGVYQAIVDGSISSNMLQDKCINYSKLNDGLRKLYDVNNINLSLVNGTYYNYNTGAIATTSTMQSALIDVSEGDEFLLTSVNTITLNVCGVMFFDSNDTMISYLLTGAYNVTDYYILVPSGAVKMGLSFKWSENKALKKITLNKPYEDIINMIFDTIDSNGKIVILGDSIGAGVDGTGYELSTDPIITISGNTYYRVKDTGYCWVNLFKKYMNLKYPNVTIINNSISGMSTNLVSTNTRLNQLIPNDTNLVICALGTNDREQSVNTIKSNLSFLMQYCYIHNIKCLLMDNKPCSNSNEASKTLHMEDISNIIKDVSNSFNNPVLDIFTLFNEYCNLKNITIDSLLSDGLHPNDAGYKVMFILFSKLINLSIPRLDCTWFDFDNI